MVEKSDDLYLHHISDACKQINSYINGIDRNGFELNKLIQDGVMKELEIIGEASRHVSPEFKAANKNIDWKNIIGMRDKLIHDYTGIDLDVVWKSATVDVPKLLKNVNPPTP